MYYIVYMCVGGILISIVLISVGLASLAQLLQEHYPIYMHTLFLPPCNYLALPLGQSFLPIHLSITVVLAIFSLDSHWHVSSVCTCCPCCTAHWRSGRRWLEMTRTESSRSLTLETVARMCHHPSMARSALTIAKSYILNPLRDYLADF